jgi:hypothetical protein
MTKRLTVIKVKGDTDELLRHKAEVMDPVFEDKVGQYGGLAHITARTDDGVLIVNLWESEEGSEQAFQDPEIQEALKSLDDQLSPETERNHYEVVDYRMPQG